LVGAEIYLRTAFPAADVRYFDPNDGAREADIILCRVEDAHALSGRTFDLAINTWSFGEMPNRYIGRWFSFLNDQNTTKAFFFVNHFMMQVCLESPTAREQLNSAAWLSKIDGRWDVVEFKVHPGIHGSPLWRHFHQGVCVVGRLFDDEESRRERTRQVFDLAANIFLEDWAQFSVILPGDDDEQPMTRFRLLSTTTPAINDATRISMTQAERYLGIIKDDIRHDESGAFFRLWNHFRLTGSTASLRLLRVLLYLKWRPALRNPTTGAPYSVISGEEYEFGILTNGRFDGDPYLLVPPWYANRLNEIFA
jgi:hypothetical protein